MKIVLAIDPFDKNLAEQEPRFETLAKWCKNTKVDVVPIYIAPADKASVVLPPIKEIEEFAPLHVVTQAGGRKKEIEALLKFAKEQDAEVIALISQGKSTLDKMVLGSFSESLLLKSEVPILFVGDKSDTIKRENKVIFLTDFSDASWRAFVLLLRQMQDRKPEIVIFNAIPLPQFVQSSPIYAHAMNLLPDAYWEEQKLLAEQEAMKFQHLATMNGYQSRIVIANQVASIDRSIRQLLSIENVKFIAMASVSNSLQRFLVGSVSRSILRDRIIRPVWICGPQCLGPEV